MNTNTFRSTRHPATACCSIRRLTSVAPRVPSVCETRHVTTLLGLIEAGLGVAAVPSMAMPLRDHPILTSVPLVDPVVTRRVEHRRDAAGARSRRPPKSSIRSIHRRADAAATARRGEEGVRNDSRGKGRDPCGCSTCRCCSAMALGIAVGHVWPHAGASLKPLSDALRRAGAR